MSKENKAVVHGSLFLAGFKGPSEFERTLKTLAALDHPYLVPLLDFGQEDGQFFVVQRYLPGGTLGGILEYMAVERLFDGVTMLLFVGGAAEARGGGGLGDAVLPRPPIK